MKKTIKERFKSKKLNMKEINAKMDEIIKRKPTKKELDKLTEVLKELTEEQVPLSSTSSG